MDQNKLKQAVKASKDVSKLLDDLVSENEMLKHQILQQNGLVEKLQTMLRITKRDAIYEKQRANKLERLLQEGEDETI